MPVDIRRAVSSGPYSSRWADARRLVLGREDQGGGRNRFPHCSTYEEVSVDEPEVRKLSAYVHVSCCVLTDTTGENHCEHPPPVVKPLPWTWRARERWGDVRERLARWVAGRRWPIEEE